MNKKLILILAVIILAILSAAFFSKKADAPIGQSFVTEKDPKLTAEERKIVEDRLADVQKKLAEMKDAADADIEKYSLTMQLGFQKNALGKLGEARDAFLAAAKLQPENYTAIAALFHIYLDMGDNDSALAGIKKAIELKPENAELWRQYIQIEKEKFSASDEKIEEIFSDAIKKTNSSVDIITVYAQFLESKGDLMGAIEQWKKAIAGFPANKDLYQEEINRMESKILRVK